VENKTRPTGEEIRQAKKFLQNKKVPLSLFKPNTFAAASKEIEQNFDKTFNTLLNVYKSGNPYYKRRIENATNTADTGDTARNKKV
jgi:hypothetical protein|tara:strand:- start:3592 stop:3849 length:258 start_codon:yes stop_codon:yes gene_type:complete